MNARALRVLLVANDGFSAGHVARTLAVARGLKRRALLRKVDAQLLLLTTSQAHALFAAEELAVVQLPSPLVARRGGLSDQERRRVVQGAIDGASEAFGPDLIVVDTFPSGPHGELTGLHGHRARRALLRRSVPDERASDEALSARIRAYQLAIVADDPIAYDVALPIPSVRVPPITMSEARDGMSREDARRALGLDPTKRVLLVVAGGGGDEDAAVRANQIAETVARFEPASLVALALGPLSRAPLPGTRVAPLQPYLAAFDGAFTAAGYNTAHELAKAAVPSALFAQPRPFDDQAARAARFARESLAFAMPDTTEESVRAALEWMRAPMKRTAIEPGGADRAADALLDLVMGR